MRWTTAGCVYTGALLVPVNVFAAETCAQDPLPAHFKLEFKRTPTPGLCPPPPLPPASVTTAHRFRCSGHMALSLFSTHPSPLQPAQDHWSLRCTGASLCAAGLHCVVRHAQLSPSYVSEQAGGVPWVTHDLHTQQQQSRRCCCCLVEVTKT